jgi:hypothetical protein
MVGSPRTRLAGAACALALAVAACGSSPQLDPTTAAVLADRADRLATLIEAGEHCAAMVEAEGLADRARAGVETGALPGSLGAEVESVALDLAADLDCEADAVTDEDEQPDTGNDRDDPGGEDDADEGRGGDRGRGGGPPPGRGGP